MTASDSAASPLHIVTAAFASEADAIAYTQPHWEPEPGDEVSDEEYQVWEDRNPVWPMKADLGCSYLDSDFIDTI